MLEEFNILKKAKYGKITGDKIGDSPDAGNVVWDGAGTGDSGNTISEGTYNLGNTNLTIDFVDVP